MRTSATDGYHRRTFSHAISFKDRHFDSRKESYYGGLYACSAGNDDVEMFRTEIFAYLFENEVVSYA